MRRLPLFVLWSLNLVFAQTAAIAQDTLPPAVPGRTDYDELALYGDAVRHVYEYQDNQYRYEVRVRQLVDQASAFQCATLQFNVEVERVTKEEVIVRLRDAGETRVLLRHTDPPYYGNLRSRPYHGSYSTLYYNSFAKPVTLRIGAEIPLEMAVQLRRRDQLLMQGQIGAMYVSIGPTFNPRAVATISNWVVLNVEPATEAERR